MELIYEEDPVYCSEIVRDYFRRDGPFDLRGHYEAGRIKIQVELLQKENGRIKIVRIQRDDLDELYQGTVDIDGKFYGIGRKQYHHAKLTEGQFENDMENGYVRGLFCSRRIMAEEFDWGEEPDSEDELGND